MYTRTHACTHARHIPPPPPHTLYSLERGHTRARTHTCAHTHRHLRNVLRTIVRFELEYLGPVPKLMMQIGFQKTEVNGIGLRNYIKIICKVSRIINPTLVLDRA